jgi:hypothetical protein
MARNNNEGLKLSCSSLSCTRPPLASTMRATASRPAHGRRWQLPNDDDDDNDIILSSSHVATPSHPLISCVAFGGVIHKIKSAY